MNKPYLYYIDKLYETYIRKQIQIDKQILDKKRYNKNHAYLMLNNWSEERGDLNIMTNYIVRNSLDVSLVPKMLKIKVLQDNITPISKQFIYRFNMVINKNIKQQKSKTTNFLEKFNIDLFENFHGRYFDAIAISLYKKNIGSEIYNQLKREEFLDCYEKIIEDNDDNYKKKVWLLYFNWCQYNMNEVFLSPNPNYADFIVYFLSKSIYKLIKNEAKTKV